MSNVMCQHNASRLFSRALLQATQHILKRCVFVCVGDTYKSLCRVDIRLDHALSAQISAELQICRIPFSWITFHQNRGNIIFFYTNNGLRFILPQGILKCSITYTWMHSDWGMTLSDSLLRLKMSCLHWLAGETHCWRPCYQCLVLTEQENSELWAAKPTNCSLYQENSSLFVVQ